MASTASVASAAVLGGSTRRRDARALRTLPRAVPGRARLRSSPTVRAGMEVQQADTRVVDFYELMGVPDDADIKTIKRAYYDLAMYCHPDRSGDDGHDLCVVLNDAYAILKDPVQREAYDAELAVQREDDLDEFTGKPYSKWTTRKAEPGETRAVFVDEFTCIGCKQCVWAAPATFRMDDDHGRSRVFAQWLDAEDDIECAAGVFGALGAVCFLVFLACIIAWRVIMVPVIDEGKRGPMLGRQFVIFIDDFNMPKRETYGAQPPIELMRQMVDHGGWYDRKTLTFRKIVDIVMVAAMGPKMLRTTAQHADIWNSMSFADNFETHPPRVGSERESRGLEKLAVLVIFAAVGIADCGDALGW